MNKAIFKSNEVEFTAYRRLPSGLYTRFKLELVRRQVGDSG